MNTSKSPLKLSYENFIQYECVLIHMTSKIEIKWTINTIFILYSFQFVEPTKINLHVRAMWQFLQLVINVLHLYLIFFIYTLLESWHNLSQLPFFVDFFTIFILSSTWNYHSTTILTILWNICIAPICQG